MGLCEYETKLRAYSHILIFANSLSCARRFGLRGCIPGGRHTRHGDLGIAATTCLANERFARLTQSSATAEPFVDLREIDLELCRLLLRIVIANRIEVSTTARIFRLGDDHTVARLLFAADTTKTNPDCHLKKPGLRCGNAAADPSGVLVPFIFVPGPDRTAF